MSAITPPFAVVGDPDAERPLLLIDAPDLRGRTWGAIPTELELLFQPTLKYGHQSDALGGQLTESAGSPTRVVVGRNRGRAPRGLSSSRRRVAGCGRSSTSRSRTRTRRP